MKKNGFTLIELLAVIIVLGLLALIIIPNVTNTIKNQQESLYKSQLEMIKEAAKGYIASHVFELNFDGTDSPITLKQLQDENYIDEEIQNPKTKTNFCNTMKINIVPVEETQNYKLEIDETTINSEPNC